MAPVEPPSTPPRAPRPHFSQLVQFPFSPPASPPSPPAKVYCHYCAERGINHHDYPANLPENAAEPTTNFRSTFDSKMAGAYEIRSGGDGKNKKQSMADLKLRRLNELNIRLKEDLDRPRTTVREASLSLIQYCNNTRDFMVPSIWGQVDKREDPYAPQQTNGCCVVM